MRNPHLSELWFRVSGLKLRLRAPVRMHRTLFRGQVWYVLQDRVSGNFHRFGPEAWFVASLLDGQRSMEEVWQRASQELDSGALTQDDVLRLLGQLHGADVLVGEVPPDIAELADRGKKQRRRKLMQSLMNPLALRLPLIDPDDFLSATLPLVRPVLSWAGAVVWLAVVIWGTVLAATHWQELTADIIDRVLIAESLILLVLTYPVVKALHELGHAYAIKRWGGAVREMGLMFLVFLPVPYVDASDSLGFASKWRRAFVAAAGILVEILLAAIAVIVWTEAESGLVRALAFNVMLIGGVSTLLFNGNPLLRFDGYYVLSDLIEIPNLGNRANKYMGWLVQRHVFRLDHLPNPASAPGEAPWFLFYGITSFLYRMVIMAAITLLVAQQFLGLGLVLAVWSVLLVLGLPLAKMLHYIFLSPALRRKRARAIGFVAAVCLVAGLVVAGLRLPYATLAEGVVLVAGEDALTTATEGVVSAVLIAPQAQVAAGEAVLELSDPLLDARVRLLEATVEERQRRLGAVRTADRAASRIAAEELDQARADLALARERQAALVLRAPKAGQVIWENPADLTGRYVRQGERLGWVTTLQDPVIRVAVPEADADLVRSDTRAVAVRMVSDPSRTLPAHLTAEVPALGRDLPSLALTPSGGGRVIADPSAPDSAPRALQNLLLVDLRLDPGTAFAHVGERVFVRFEHAPQSLMDRTWRRLRQVFLDQLAARI